MSLNKRNSYWEVFWLKRWSFEWWTCDL